MIENKISYLPFGASVFHGVMDSYVSFAIDHQLSDRRTWEKFVEVFSEDSDDDDLGWRCEYYGKMMRGAALTYMYRPDEKLYSVLEDTSRALLKNQRKDGRFSTYSDKLQFNGWDMWGRKYVTTGLLHFYRICKDNKLGGEIIDALIRHADHIIANVGKEEGKKEIVTTSSHWLGVNSCSILETFIDLYSVTGEKRFLDFATYVVSTGGCSGGNLIDIALEDKLYPYQYPEVKAYETMSFFEGVLAYYTVTGEEKYLRAVENFVKRVKESDVTIIGCSGCTHELFDNSAIKQTRYSTVHMQETCVTVTWMRLLARLYMLNGNHKLISEVERSGYNALYGSANTEDQTSFAGWTKEIVESIPFDSYSPLYNNKRGLATGGFKKFKSGGYYGCCACIAAAGVALMPLLAATERAGELVINMLEEGSVTLGGLNAKITSSSPASFETKIEVTSQESTRIHLRIPEWATNARAFANGDVLKITKDYLTVEIEKGTTEITLDLTPTLTQEKLEGRTAYIYGPIVLARDEKKEGAKPDTEFTPDGSYTLEKPKKGETTRILLGSKEGKVLLVDYASAGKKWMSSGSTVSVWLNAK